VSRQLEARETLESLVSRYASLRSYRDRGVVVHRGAGGNEAKVEIAFATFYEEPRFRFEFRKPDPRSPRGASETHHAIGFDGNTAYCVRRTEDGETSVQAVDSIGTAVMRTTGISRGSSHTIGRLLMQEMDGLSYLDLLNVRLRDLACIDGVECYVITADHPQLTAKYQLWIEKDRLLLRKRIADHGGWMSEESREEILIDEPIEWRIFERPDSAARPEAARPPEAAARPKATRPQPSDALTPLPPGAGLSRRAGGGASSRRAG
jgi:hypothetical protein